MVVGVIIPDRGDRPRFVDHLKYMLNKQTRKPNFVAHVNFAPTNNVPDLTKRIRLGFNNLKSKGCDVVLIIENDDYYSEHYISDMVSAWQENGKPLIFGTNQTIYYHIKKREYSVLNHNRHASLMNTVLSTKQEINWCDDSEIFLDRYLWKTIKGQTISTPRLLSVGIKHGVGLCGGSGHSRMEFEFKDSNFEFLSDIVDSESLKVYKTIFDETVYSPIKKQKLAIVSACWKRPEIFEMFANATKKLKNDALEIVVIIAGSEGVKSRNMVEKHGFHYIETPNQPLATKVNAPVLMAGSLGVDYILCVGSDDLITNELLDVYLDCMNRKVDFVGVLDWYFYDTVSNKFTYWGGYRDERRKGHTCGAGRLISARLLSLWNWKPWEIKDSHILDNSMQDKLKRTPHSFESFRLTDKNVLAFDVKSSVNMTPFELWDNTKFIYNREIENTFKKLICAE